jgi:type I restriction enzyme, S subunit
MMHSAQARWSQLRRWDFKSSKALAFRLAHPDFRPLGDIVEEATVLVDPRQRPDEEWPVYGVNNRDGVFLNEYREGREFNANQKRIEQNWFFHNPTRANVGSLGRVPNVEDNALTSPEYQVWRLREGSALTADFVEVLIRTPFFLDLVRWHRTGSVKERLFVANLCEIPVPVVPPSEQIRLVTAVQEARRKVSAARKELAEAELGVGNYLASLTLPI